MLIVVDETIGFSASSLPFGEDTPIVIKPAKTMKKDKTFKEYIESQSSSIYSKSIRLSSYSMEDEIEYFSQIFHNQSGTYPVIYFYDPSYTNHPVIRRIQNVFQPDKKLYPLPAAVNRAETLYIMNELLKNKEHILSSALTYRQLRHLIKSWIKGASGWVLSPNIKSIFNSRTPHKVYRKKKKNVFTQLRIDQSGNLESQKKGTLEGIWEDISKDLRGKEAWVVTKGTELPGSGIAAYNLAEETFPVNIPYIQVFEPSMKQST